MLARMLTEPHTAAVELDEADWWNGGSAHRSETGSAPSSDLRWGYRVLAHIDAGASSGDAYRDQIDPAFIVKVDGKEVGSGSVDVDHNDGRQHSETFTFSQMLAEGPHSIEIGFVNDNNGPAGSDINLEIQDVKWNGVSYGPDTDVTLRSNGWFAVNVDI